MDTLEQFKIWAAREGYDLSPSIGDSSVMFREHDTENAWVAFLAGRESKE